MTWPPKQWLEFRLDHEARHAKSNAVMASIWIVGAFFGCPWFLWLPCVAVFGGATIDHALGARKAKRALAARKGEASLTLLVEGKPPKPLTWRQVGDETPARPTSWDDFDDD